ncbi:hypothetical protein [Terriglobus albidus]|uniref:hypothetical protein n=1 Tax=Terriglobus albidus TaxID=1592106 RepID=UPI0021DFC541|nr:hypothetical protein [Terriglobus albidus]
MIGYLYQDQAQQDVKASDTDYVDNSVDPPIVWAGVETTSPVHQGSVYTIYSEHYLETYFDYEEGDYYNPYQYPPGASFTSPGGGDPTGTGYDSGGGQVYVDQEIIYLGYTYFQFGTAPPSISSINPSSVVRGTSGTIQVQGQNLRDDLGRLTASSRDGDLSVSVASGDAASASLNYSVSGTASVGTHQFTVSNTWGESEPANLTVGYPPAVVTGVSPNVWVAGNDYDVTVTGTGFGTNPTVSAVASGVSSGVAHNSSPDGTTTYFHVHVAPNAPNEPVQIIVVPGYSGSNYICGNCNGGSGTGSSAVSVEAATPIPQITFNGANISGTTQAVWAGQKIALSVPTPNGYNIQSQSWSFSNQSAITGGFTNQAGSDQPSASGGGQEAADPPLNQNALTFYWVNPGDNGETVTYTYTLDNGQSANATATFNISGPTGNLLPNAFAQSNITGTSLANPQAQVATMAMANSPAKPGVGVFINDNAQPVSDGTQCPAHPGAAPAAGCGQFIWVQILNSVIRSQIIPVGEPFDPNNASNQLDGTYPYASGINPNGTYSSNATWDSPGRGLLHSWGEAAEPFRATMYVLWDPALPAGCIPAWVDTTIDPYKPHASQGCTSIPIPLGSVQWSWSACAINALAPAPGGGTTPSWFLQCGTGSGNTAGAGSGYPQWLSGTGPGGCATSDHANCQ